MSTNPTPKPWQIHGERLVYDNPWVQLALVDVEPPGGKRFEHHVVRLSRAAIALVMDDKDRALMMWRYRFVPGRFGWELPGGIIEPGEDAAKAAAREVEEETGWRPGTLHRLLTFQPMVGMVDSPHEYTLRMVPQKWRNLAKTPRKPRELRGFLSPISVE